VVANVIALSSSRADSIFLQNRNLCVKSTAHSYAGSRSFVTRDETGKTRQNTSYLLRALTAVAANTASRPYRKRAFVHIYRLWFDSWQ
jgi:hypothetical protein